MEECLILAFGNFCQLPPVKQKTLLGKYEDTWNPLDSFKKLELTEIIRQKDDLHFAEFLNRIRLLKSGESLSEDDEIFLENIANKSPPDNVMRAYGLNKDVDHYNLIKVNEHAAQSGETLHEIYPEDYSKDKKKQNMGQSATK